MSYVIALLGIPRPCERRVSSVSSLTGETASVNSAASMVTGIILIAISHLSGSRPASPAPASQGYNQDSNDQRPSGHGGGAAAEYYNEAADAGNQPYSGRQNYTQGGLSAGTGNDIYNNGEWAMPRRHAAELVTNLA